MQILIGPHQMAEIGQVSIQVRRDHVLEDSMQQLQLHLSELRKPLRITFLGGEHGAIKEEAVDEGAPPPSEAQHARTARTPRPTHGCAPDATVTVAAPNPPGCCGRSIHWSSPASGPVVDTMHARTCALRAALHS